METLKPVPIELPPPESQAALLASYLEGIPLVQIARGLQLGIPAMLEFLRQPDVRECIEQYEESIEKQTRLYAQASRIPAMTTLREVCVSEGSLAERRRAASDLLRQSHAADKPAKGRRFGRTAHNTPTPEKFIPNPDATWSPDIPREVRPLEPYEMTLDLNVKPTAAWQTASSTSEGSSSQLDQPPASEPDQAPIQSESPTPAPSQAESQAQAPTPAQVEPAPKTEGSFTAQEHTASWHAFDRDEPSSSAPSPETTAATPSEQAIDPQPLEPQPLLVQQPPTSIASPYDSFCAREVSTPLPDAVPVAA